MTINNINLYLIGIAASVCAVSSCTTDESLLSAPSSEIELSCILAEESGHSRATADELGSGVYGIRWQQSDEIAVFAENSSTPSKFKLIRGAGEVASVFSGAVSQSDSYTAIAPYSYVRALTGGFATLEIPNEISLTDNTFPMVMVGTSRGKNMYFYNTMSCLKLMLKGTGVVSSIKISSPEGKSLSGNAYIRNIESDEPKLEMEGSGASLTVNVGRILLSEDKETYLLIPIPVGTYSSLSFTVSCTGDYAVEYEVQATDGQTQMERSHLRPLKIPAIKSTQSVEECPAEANELWIKTLDGKAPALVDEPFLDEVKMSSTAAGWTVYVFNNDVNELNKSPFVKPEQVIGVKLPTRLKKLSYAFQNTAIKAIDLPSSLQNLGLYSFAHTPLEYIVVPEGVKTMDYAFENCEKMEWAELPESLEEVMFYSFLNCIKMKEFRGKCKLVDSDGHTIYSNTGYGLVSENPDQADFVAGATLTEYTAPDQAEYYQNYAFVSCMSLKTLRLHKNVKSIATDPFGQQPTSSDMVSIYLECESQVVDVQFDGTQCYTPIHKVYVPASLLDEYLKHPHWGKIKERIEAIK